jgi:lipid-A-disaccharide synthase
MTGDEIANPDSIRQTARECISATPSSKVIGLIPGSRESEIIRHLPIMLGAARLIQKQIPDCMFLLPKASTVPDSLLRKYLDRFPDVKVLVSDVNHKALRTAMDFAICKSGTSTLEFAIVNVPMIIIYKASWLTGAIARRVLKIPFLGLVNIVAGKAVAPEILQQDATPDNIAEAVVGLLNSPEKLAEMKRGLAEVKLKLGGAGASKRAALEIARVLTENATGLKA